MKNHKFIIVFFVILIVLNLTLAKAETSYKIEPDISGIDQYLTDNKYKFDYEEILNTIKEGHYKKLVSIFIGSIKDEFEYNLVYYKNIMLRLFSVCLIFMFFKIFFESQNEYTDVIILFFVFGIVIELYLNMYTKCYKTVSGITEFIKATLPVYFGTTTIFTGKLPLSVYGVFVIFIGLFQWLCLVLIFPLQNFSFLCTALGGIYNGFDFAYLKKQITGIVRIILGAYTTFFILGMKLTQTISYSSQKVILTGVQYTLTNGIPVIGGFLSETAETLLSSVILLHNSVGISAVIVVFIIVFLPFITIFSISLIIKLSCSLLFTLFDSKFVKTVYEFGECICELSVVLLCCSVTFIIGLATEFISVR